MEMEKKLGVYICEGCGIGEAVDIERIRKNGVPKKIEICRNHPIMCSPEGLELIKKDIGDEGVNTVVIAACSQRVLYDVFDFGPVIVRRANLREGVVWSHKPQEDRISGEEGAPQVDQLIQEMAEDYVRMGIATAEKVLPPEPYLEETFDKKIVVLGGGVTGLSAALDAAKAGYETLVIEKQAKIGGFATKMRKQTPSSYPYEELQPPVIDQIIKEAEAHPKIEIRTGTEIARIAGSPALFDITFKAAGTKSAWDVMSAEEEACVRRNEQDHRHRRLHRRTADSGIPRRITSRRFPRAGDYRTARSCQMLHREPRRAPQQQVRTGCESCGERRDAQNRHGVPRAGWISRHGRARTGRAGWPGRECDHPAGRGRVWCPEPVN